MPYALMEDATALYYEITGQGTPIVFIHPPIMGHLVFKHQKRLSKDYQPIFYDLRGHGKSSKGNTALSIELLAKDIKCLLDELNIPKAVVCGFSNGGTIAQEFALLYPERTEALILTGGYSRVDSLNLKSMLRFGMVMAKIHKIPIVAKIQARSHKYFKEDENEFYQYGKLADSQSVYEFCKAGLTYNSTRSLYRLKMPVLLVYGSQEKTMHHYRLSFQQHASNVKVVYIDGASHEVPPRHFPEFNRVVHQFIQSQKYRS
ncbi:alpha/beta hydrolase [Planococcus sp. ISL-110]|uniref:alpha/beta fold hydrolase n=1 Tax=Planococcus sp. ISL-110 TaxID=2819167 RepID=UPI001BEB1FF3|nr:alpha/beta hydrolase [Planococcus sp. ISL-110]MBT2571408.1 alpha/beta hydrolase [Planococcus sp. ISL-110]